MKKSISAIALAATILLSGCGSTGGTLNGDSTNISNSNADVSNSNSSSKPPNNHGGVVIPATPTPPWGDYSISTDGLEELTDYVFVSYDRDPLRNISNASCYYAARRQFSESALDELFKQKPEKTYGGDENRKNVFYDAGDESGMLSEFEYVARYHTVRGANLDSYSYQYYDRYSTELEFDFLSREELKSDFTQVISKFIPSDVDFEVYAITADEYRELANWLISLESEGETSRDREALDMATDFYFVSGTQSVDNIPMAIYGANGTSDGNSMFYGGSRFWAVYTDKGLEYIYIANSYDFGETAPSDGDFISFDEAEQIFKSHFDSYFRTESEVYSKVELRYGLVDNDGTVVLTPIWIFWNDACLNLTENQLYIQYSDTQHSICINAITGEVALS